MALSKKYINSDIRLEVVKLLEVFREEIRNAGAVATGNLENFTYDIHSSGYDLQITINLPYYFKFIDKGVNGWQQSQGSPYSFKSRYPSRQMVESILQWITVKKILPRSKVTGRFIKKEQGAYAISHGILKNGIKARKITTAVKKKEIAIMKDIRQMVAKGILDEAGDIISTFYN